ncbi:MAG: hypothetical protein LRY43_02785, partial [Gammaproteobacteria bacterium]|nr:hypothetical protein [Gammaproteobacteria bacterium]
MHCGHAWLIRRTVEYAKKASIKSILLVLIRCGGVFTPIFS